MPKQLYVNNVRVIVGSRGEFPSHVVGQPAKTASMLRQLFRGRDGNGPEARQLAAAALGRHVIDPRRSAVDAVCDAIIGGRCVLIIGLPDPQDRAVTMKRGAPDPGGFKRPPGAVVEWSVEQRFEAVLWRTADRLGGDVVKEFKAFMTPQNILMMVGVLTLWAASHLTPAGWIFDGAMLGLALWQLGRTAIEGFEKLALFLQRTLSARRDEDLDEAAELLSRALSIISVELFIKLVTKVGRKIGRGGDATPKTNEDVLDNNPDRRSLVLSEPTSSASGAKRPAGNKSQATVLTAAQKKTYARPSGYRKGVRDAAWEAAKGPDGKVRDPGTGIEIKPGDPWDMGHKPGYEFRKHQISAAERGLTREQFLDEHNNAMHYRPELPSSNRSGRFEELDGDWLGAE